MTHIGIIGSGQDKFTKAAEIQAKAVIDGIISSNLKTGWRPIVVSGHSPVGGVDIWAEEASKKFGLVDPIIYGPRCDICGESAVVHKTFVDHLPVYSWSGEYGYRRRNIDIAMSSDKLHVIVVNKYPPHYSGQRFSECYHCHKTTHIKSGACWTAKKFAIIKNKVALYWIIQNR
jgi:hypothetical protein